MKYQFETASKIDGCVRCPCVVDFSDYDGWHERYECGLVEKTVEGNVVPDWCPLVEVEE